MNIKELNLTQELHKTITKSLVSSFGLDFLLFEDKQGGNVDTIHNVRQGIYATETAKQNYENREKYNSHDYHSHKNYIATGRADKAAQQDGQLQDNYRNQIMGRNEDRQLDHTISASEISNDAGRVLAGLNGSELANMDSNLNSTHWYLNNLKREHSIEKCLNEIYPNKLNELKVTLQKQKNNLKTMAGDTPKSRHEKRQQESEIQKTQEKVEALETALKNKDSMISADKKARTAYEIEINKYYQSSEFLKSLSKTSLLSGVKMGLRQSVGLVLAEVWFELRSQLPTMLRKYQANFSLETFLNDVKQTILNIFERVKNRFKDLLIAFKDGGIAGLLSEVTNSLINIFATTYKIVGRLLREMYSTLVDVARLVFFNPDKLSAGQLVKEVIKLLGAGVATLIGVGINVQLNTLISTIPFGMEISAFIGALVTGLITLGVAYYVETSSFMAKIFNFLDNLFKSDVDYLLEQVEEMNRQLDEFLLELGRVELNFNPEELKQLNDSLLATNDEYQRSIILSAEMKKRKLELPFEANNIDSINQWLSSL